MNQPFLVAVPIKSFDLKEEEDAIYASIDLSNLAAQHSKQWVENDYLFVTAISKEVMKESGNKQQSEGLQYTTSLAITPEHYETDGIMVALKEGVLKAVISKRNPKEEEPKPKEEKKGGCRSFLKNILDKGSSFCKILF